ncbi:MAG: DEAD/DEAH box helicase [Desulfocapsaceae bacterium]|nr:DEAD/DEAH box helicase [Desulfocapsaceae bacterium]
MSFDTQAPLFSDFNLSQPLLQALDDAGYESPTPIQIEMIPHVMAGRDVVGQAQTGTGKTAAFALPLLANIDLRRNHPQVLVLAPTRELALQVAEAFQTYGAHLKNLKIAAIFGGQDYTTQISALKRGPQVIVGTPGRVMDHIRRQSLKMDNIVSLVLDEADEMLNMGFIDDVEWVLTQLPEKRQISLFSATMPASIRSMAKKYLTDPVEITIKSRTATATTIHQRYILTDGFTKKIEALGRVLEMEAWGGVLIFVRTKIQTVELAEKLSGLGYACAPLCGDIPQNQRLRTVEQLKSGKLDILVATDVAARGLDVERISHVINFDIPFDNEAYIHRIGRTGRAGRKGEAILFIHPREKRMLHSIEALTRQKIEMMALPTVREINGRRIAAFKERITTTLNGNDFAFFRNMIDEYLQETQVPAADLAAALARIAQGDKPFFLKESAVEKRMDKQDVRRETGKSRHAADTGTGNRPVRKRAPSEPEPGMDRYRIEVGQTHGVRPGNIVGAIANEAEISSEHIGRISIFDDHSTIDLPFGMPEDILHLLKKVRINERMLKISRLDSAPRQNGKRTDSRPPQPERAPLPEGKRIRRKGQRKGMVPTVHHA